MDGAETITAGWVDGWVAEAGERESGRRDGVPEAPCAGCWGLRRGRRIQHDVRKEGRDLWNSVS